jgi:hypothetical protein
MKTLSNYLIIATMAIAMCFTACEKDSKNDNGGGGGEFVIEVQNVKYSNSDIIIVKAVVCEDFDSDYFEGNRFEAGSGLYENGGFKLSLSEIIPNEYLMIRATDIMDEDEIEGDKEVKMGLLGLIAYNSKGEEIGAFRYGQKEIWEDGTYTRSTLAYLYTDRKFSIKGKDENNKWWYCPLEKGWNRVYYNEELTVFTTTKPLNDNFYWWFDDWTEND